jgi:hypothetical protein
MNDIIIPSPVYMKWPKNLTCVDSPTPVLQIKYEGLSITKSSTNFALLTLTNKSDFTIQPKSYATVNFDILVRTSLPAVSILYGSDFLFRHGITCVVNMIPTNDAMLHIKIYNHKSVPTTFDKKSLQFTCHTVLAKYP